MYRIMKGAKFLLTDQHKHLNISPVKTQAAINRELNVLTSTGTEMLCSVDKDAIG